MSKRQLSLVAMVGFLVLAMLPALADSAVPPTFVSGGTDCTTVSSAPGGLSLTIVDPVVDGTYEGSDGSMFVLTNATRRMFDFSTDGALVYDVVVKGSGSNWYDYDGTGDGPVRSDTDLVIPNGNKLNLVHFCYSGNTPPVAAADSYSTNEDTLLTVSAALGVLANDTDADPGETLTAALVTDVSNGTLNLISDGSFTYDPDPNFNGPDSFTYKTNDGFADSAAATVTITVNAVNDAPVATADSYMTDEDTQLNVAAPGVLANDSDADGDSLTAIEVSDVSNAVTLNANGSFTFTPPANFNGDYSFTYKANDGFADSNTVTVTITVNAVNDPPVAVDDPGNETVAGQAVDINVLANDSDVDSSALTVTNLTTSAGATAVFSTETGLVTYTPADGFIGTDTFTYTANDGTSNSNTATVTVTVFAGDLGCGENASASDESGISATFFRLVVGPCQTAKLFTINIDPLAGDNGEVEFLIDPAFTEEAEYTAKLTFAPFLPGNPNTQTFTWDLDNPGILTAADWCESATFDGNGNLTSAVPPGVENGCVASQSTVTVGPNGEAQTTWWVYFKFDLKTRG